MTKLAYKTIYGIGLTINEVQQYFPDYICQAHMGLLITSYEKPWNTENVSNDLGLVSGNCKLIAFDNSNRSLSSNDPTYFLGIALETIECYDEGYVAQEILKNFFKNNSILKNIPNHESRLSKIIIPF